MITRRELQRDATREEIKARARQQMAAEGTGAISIRGIAREMGFTAPAIYRYYASRDDLITDLILDAFNALADALEAAVANVAEASITEQLMAFVIAYREWAMAHPVDFQLIYGNPIAGYEAPADKTVPAASRTFQIVVNLFQRGVEGQSFVLPDRPIPESVAGHLKAMAERDGYTVNPAVLYAAVMGWTRMHGIIMLEIFNHLQPVIGDVGAFYRHEMQKLINEWLQEG